MHKHPIMGEAPHTHSHTHSKLPCLLLLKTREKDYHTAFLLLSQLPSLQGGHAHLSASPRR